MSSLISELIKNRLLILKNESARIKAECDERRIESYTILFFERSRI